MPDFLTVCEEAARAGGAELQNWVGKFQVREKGPRDLVTQADVASQQVIRGIVMGRFPDHGFVGEENGEQQTPDTPYRWIVDPLDGTSNYAHGVPHYCVSVALEGERRLLAGAVYDPVLDECFAAAAGQGARLNGRPIQVSRVTSLAAALVATSFPARVTADLPVVAELVAVLPACQAFRRGGSAALNLAYIAAGRFEAYWAADLHPWDAAAGVLLVLEAGGVVTDLDGGPFDVWNPKLLAAAGPDLHQQLFAVLTTTRPDRA